MTMAITVIAITLWYFLFIAAKTIGRDDATVPAAVVVVNVVVYVFPPAVPAGLIVAVPDLSFFILFSRLHTYRSGCCSIHQEGI